MKENTFAKVTIILILSCLFLTGLFNFIVDPFCYYRVPSGKLQFVSYGEMNQNLNLARNAQYDAVLTGTSMTENFGVTWFNEKYDCNTAKLTFAGAGTKDFTQLFSYVFKAHPDLKYVFFGVDIFTLTYSSEKTRFEYEKYQISDNPIYDLSYLLSGEILLNYSLNTLLNTKNNYNPNNEIFSDNMYAWHLVDNINYGKEAVLSSYERPNKTDEEKSAYITTEDNLDEICEYIEKYPNTEFILFFPPYSICNWDIMNQNNDIDRQIGVLNLASERFLQYPNVKLYDFVADESIITNLDYYKDYTHYSIDVNRYIFDHLDDNSHLLTKENYRERLEKFHSYLKTYDYDSLYE